VKKGLGALNGNSGIDRHIQDFESIVKSRNSAKYIADLKQDVRSIISDKASLGLISDIKLNDVNFNSDIQFVFVFEPDKDGEEKIFNEILQGRYYSCIISSKSYKLS
jgi:hypothetical protein